MSERLRIPVPERYRGGTPRTVDVADVLARENCEAVFWYEIAALCEALLERAATGGAGAPARPVGELRDWCDRCQESYPVNDCPKCSGVPAREEPGDEEVARAWWYRTWLEPGSWENQPQDVRESIVAKVRGVRATLAELGQRPGTGEPR